MARILLIGSGAREHVVAETFKKNAKSQIFSYMKFSNPGIAKFSQEIKIGNYDELEKIKEFASGVKPDFAFIGPEEPLYHGVVDMLDEIGIKSVGPKRILAQIETSKSFTRELIRKYNINGNPKFKVFTSLEGIREFMKELRMQFVIKADGLRGGKGVKVIGEHLNGIDEGIEYCRECIAIDGKVVIEEKLIGQEFSMMFFCDGISVIGLVPSQDYKRAYDGDLGENTGGVGSYSDSNHLLPFLKQEEVNESYEITLNVCNALKNELNEEYKGVLYGGFMLTKKGIRLIEYNARLGDPEAMNVLPILKTDFVELCTAVIDGTLYRLNVESENKATVCKYVVPEGYPVNPVKNERIEVNIKESDNLRVYYASVDKRDDGLFMTSSRAVAIVGISDTIYAAEKIAENAISNINGKVFHRKDIGTKENIEKKVAQMR